MHVERSVRDHCGQARKAVQPVGVDAVARRLGEEARTERGALIREAKVQHCAQEDVIQFGVGNAGHGFPMIVADAMKGGYFFAYSACAVAAF
jgi:hypothetical protein